MLNCRLFFLLFLHKHWKIYSEAKIKSVKHWRLKANSKKLQSASFETRQPSMSPLKSLVQCHLKIRERKETWCLFFLTFFLNHCCSLTIFLFLKFYFFFLFRSTASSSLFTFFLLFVYFFSRLLCINAPFSIFDGDSPHASTFSPAWHTLQSVTRTLSFVLALSLSHTLIRLLTLHK